MNLMKTSLVPALCVALVLPALAATEPSREWIDPDTGHRVVRLSDEPGTASLYFNQNAYSPDGKKIVVTTHHGISTIELATRKIEPVVEGEVRVIVVGRKSGDVYFSKWQDGKNWIFATNLDTKATRKIAVLPRGGVATVNADETLMAGAFSDGDDRGWQRGETPAAAATAKGPDMGNTAAAQPTVGGAQPTVLPSCGKRRVCGVVVNSYPR